MEHLSVFCHLTEAILAKTVRVNNMKYVISSIILLLCCSFLFPTGVITVKPGESVQNSGGTYSNAETAPKGSKVKVGTPTISKDSEGRTVTKRQVDVVGGAEAIIEAADGDVINIDGNSKMDVSGSNFDVHLPSHGSNGSITNTGTGKITVHAGNHKITVPPGSSIQF